MQKFSDPLLLHSLKTVIRTRHFERLRDFYSQILGLNIVEAWDEEDDRGCIFGFGRTGEAGFLEISAVRASEKSHANHQLRANTKVVLQLRAQNLDAWAHQLTRSGIDFEGPILRPWGNRYLWLRDPDGVPIALYEETDQ